MTRLLAILILSCALAGCAYNDSHVNDWAEKHPEFVREQFKYPD